MQAKIEAEYNTVQSVKDCKDCQGLENIRAMTKNSKNTNQTINRHRYEIHGIPFLQQEQQQQERSKKHIISKGAEGLLSDEESDYGLIDGFAF